MAEFPKWITLGQDIGQVLVTDAEGEQNARTAHAENVKAGKDAEYQDDPRRRFPKK